MKESLLQHVPELTTQIYQGSLEAKPWQSFLRGLRVVTGSDSATMTLRKAKDGVASLTFFDSLNEPSAEHVRDISLEYARLGHPNPLISTLSRTGGIFTIDQVIERNALLQSDFYLKLMQPAGVEHMLAMHFPESGGADCFLGLLRGPDKQNFGDEEKQLLLSIKPHLEYALKVHSKIKRNEIEKEIYSEAMNRLAIGTIVLDGHGKVLELNRTAKDILQRNSGISLNDKNLALAKPRYRDEFNRLVRAAIEWRETQRQGVFAEALRVDCAAGADLGLLIRPAPDTDWYQDAGTPSVVVYIEDFGGDTRAPEQVVARLFGLTKSEARLAALLASGLTLTDAAVKLNLTESSVRTYSKKIFAKMGVGRQAELVRLILKSVAQLAKTPDYSQQSARAII